MLSTRATTHLRFPVRTNASVDSAAPLIVWSRRWRTIMCHHHRQGGFLRKKETRFLRGAYSMMWAHVFSLKVSPLVSLGGKRRPRTHIGPRPDTRTHGFSILTAVSFGHRLREPQIAWATSSEVQVNSRELQ